MRHKQHHKNVYYGMVSLSHFQVLSTKKPHQTTIFIKNIKLHLHACIFSIY